MYDIYNMSAACWLREPAYLIQHRRENCKLLVKLLSIIDLLACNVILKIRFVKNGKIKVTVYTNQQKCVSHNTLYSKPPTSSRRYKYP